MFFDAYKRVVHTVAAEETEVGNECLQYPDALNILHTIDTK